MTGGSGMTEEKKPNSTNVLEYCYYVSKHRCSNVTPFNREGHGGSYLNELTVVSVEKGVGSADGAVGCQCPGRGGAGVVADITPPVAGDGWDTNHTTWTSHLLLPGMAETQTTQHGHHTSC